ncbi:hypothetical protein ACX9NE_20380 [Mycobacterium sp. ML4]
MADISHLGPEVVRALRTGELPPGAKRLVEQANDTASEPDDAHFDDEERFRALYRQMVEERVADWYDTHPSYLHGLPPSELQRIRSDCENYVQRRWAAHLNRFRNREDEHEHF